ncbi:MAG TPA: VWA domain-containing protein [Verrucomicrobiae bacterium]
MRFENQNLLWLLLVVPPMLIVFFWWALRIRQKLLTRFIEARLLTQLTVGVSLTRQKLRFTLLILAAIFLILTLARPQHGFDLQEVEQRGLDIVVAVDTSKSMLTADIAPNRLERAKLAALELMQKAKTDRIGLIAFAGDAFLECPLTIDNTAFQQSVQALDVNSIPQGGTDLAAAIRTTADAFKENGHHKVLVLFTDGEDNESETGALAAAEAAAKDGLKIFTVGIGTAAGEMIHVTDANGNSDYIRDENGNVVKSHLNEPLLKQIAEATGGFYLPLHGADTIDALYERGLSVLPQAEGAGKMVQRYHEQFQWPLAVVILLLIVEILFPERKRAVKSGGKVSAATKLALLLIMAGGLSNRVSASPASAWQDFHAGNYTNALTEYERLAQVDTNDLRLVFNAGTAAYRATNFDLALRDFQLVTLSPDLKLQQSAYYNQGNTQYRLGELKFEPNSGSLDAMEETWKQALTSYQRAVSLNTNDVNAVYNLGFVQNQIELINHLREVMQKAKMSADEAVRRNEFHEALQIMESLTQNKIAAKKFEDYVKKLKDIDAILTPSAPPAHP